MSGHTLTQLGEFLGSVYSVPETIRKAKEIPKRSAQPDLAQVITALCTTDPWSLQPACQWMTAYHADRGQSRTWKY
jgi:hypothetical protein